MHKVEPSGVILHGSVIFRPSAARPKLVGLSPPSGGRLVGRKSMYAGRVSKKRCAVASGRLRGHECGSLSEAPDCPPQRLSMPIMRPTTKPNKGLQATASSVRSFLAPALRRA